MDYAVIFAGGVGRRMNNGALPKQFLEVHSKPIIIYTLEKFEHDDKIDGIVVICVSGWEDYLQEKLDQFGIKKVKQILTGGAEAIDSQFIGVQYVYTHLPHDAQTAVLLHDGVRPLIDTETIDANIATVHDKGTAITVVPAIETIGVGATQGKLDRFVDRSQCVLARAPQSYRLEALYQTFKQAQDEGRHDFIDSASMMQHYGVDLYTVAGSTDNIKVTTPTDFYIFRAILDARENSQIFGGQG
ncbi:MAG: 2-C-methyl-D-erythritol 4-phosphate cytidylyltransferase [Lactobacillus sp.]|jgi:2-C-methyl-D-erythritol 4-phosphate cytidylyltransferase|nr:2-C-methyl-D-erythritol 4-phosphate cytidylyltransferase [Lactobacillus sp.]MCI2034283.1 2-C-methyl-D-erythritol 4-phosphate cytidylyltransferase [Lactobacillus sp.]